MAQPEKPMLFNNPANVVLRPDEKLVRVYVEISPEGCYNGNGKFKDPGDILFQIVGFDRTKEREFWIGRGYTVIKHRKKMKGGV